MEVRFSCTVRGLKPILERLRDPRFQQSVQKNFSQLGAKVVKIECEELKSIRDTGYLSQSVQYMVGPMKVTIGPSAPYTLYVYGGGRPHWVGVGRIAGWAARKGLNPYRVQKSIALRGTSVWAAAKYGTSGGNPFPERTLKRGDTQAAIQQTANRIGVDLVARIESG